MGGMMGVAAYDRGSRAISAYFDADRRRNERREDIARMSERWIAGEHVAQGMAWLGFRLADMARDRVAGLGSRGLDPVSVWCPRPVFVTASARDVDLVSVLNDPDDPATSSWWMSWDEFCRRWTGAVDFTHPVAGKGFWAVPRKGATRAAEKALAAAQYWLDLANRLDGND